MNDKELIGLLQDLESDRVERKASVSDKEKICQAICAFANDLPGHRRAGVVFIGASDDGTPASGFQVDDRLILSLSDLRDNGNIEPFPVMSVTKHDLEGFAYAVIVVQPSQNPPIRFKGSPWIRVGSRRAIASREEEHRLNEKRMAFSRFYDISVVPQAQIDDLDLNLFNRVYLPSALPPDVLLQNSRSEEERLAALRFAGGSPVIPTVLGILTIGKDPLQFLPGAYIQFLRFEGTELGDPIKDEKRIDGPLIEGLRQLDELLRLNLSVEIDISSAVTEIRRPDYPIVALRQLALNAVLHRNYETSNAPVRIYWFKDRVEIYSPGGPFGQVSRDNFGQPGITDYRNPDLAEVMKNLGYVQKFGVGIQTAIKALRENGNPADDLFEVNENNVLAVIRRRS